MLRIKAWFVLVPLLRAAAAENDCPGTVRELQDIADEHLKSARLQQAEQLTRSCLARWTRTRPAGHPDVTSAQSYLGLVTMLSGRLDDAEQVLKESYRQAQAYRDPEAIAAAAAYLGSFYRYQRDTARALPLLRTAHRIMSESEGAESGMVGALLMEIGALLAGDGKFALAADAFTEAKRVLEKNRLVAEVKICEIYLAATEVERGRLTDAEPRLRRAIEQEDDPSAMAASTRTMALYHIARLYRLMKRSAEADRYYREALAAYEKTAIPPFPHVSVVAAEYADFLKQQHRPEANSWAAKAKAWKEK
jgi:tetratricopeptide (TPR) repeat protein